MFSGGDNPMIVGPAGVGKSDLMDEIETVLEAVEDSENPPIIEGEPGIGKSDLVEMFVRLINGTQE